VEFYYEGGFLKNNCEHWSRIVKNPVAISDYFCRNELPQYTYTVCRCTDPEGNQVVWTPPSAAPSSRPSTVAESKEEESPTSKAHFHIVISTSLVLVGTYAMLNMLM
jgi:hypothetical protein